VIRLAVSAPAKVNLHLQVIGRRPDGFHEVRTLLQSVDLADELEAEPAPAGTLDLEVEPAGFVERADNLVLRAARALWDLVDDRPGARMRLHKRIPVGAGLGGGSADAAAALVLLDQLWSLDLDRTSLHRVAATLGSDVPFFLHGGLALGVGRGEEVYPLPDLGELGVVLAVPGVSISTPEVYRRLGQRLTWRPPDASVYCLAVGLSTEVPWKTFRNDLQPVVLEGWPQVAAAADLLRDCGPLYWSVTGSGSASFAVFSSQRAAEGAADAARDRWWVHSGTTLSRARSRPQVRRL